MKKISPRVMEIISAILCVLFILAFVYICVVEPKKNIENEIISWAPCVVEAGDTLWELVPRCHGYDVQEIIDIVMEHNNISENIKEGMVIELPIFK